ncbi:MAG: peptidylprolyl isomerase [Erythrobacter sp.]
MTLKTISNCLLSVAAMAAIAAPTNVSAQASASVGNTLGIPDNVTILGSENPNERRATAVVNGQVITGTDVDHRVALVTSASTNDISSEELQRLRMQVLRNLIDETLQIQEANALEMEVSPAEIDSTYANVASQNFAQETGLMDEYLASIGSSVGSLKRQIHGELAWQRILRRNVTPFINVSEEEVNELLQRMEKSRGTEEYRLGEIFLSATPENQAAIQQNATQIVDQLRAGGSFVAYARQFSEASTAAVGGDLGFVRAAQLPVELSSVVSEMQAGQLVGPVPIPGGFSILYLIDKRQVLMADPRDAILSLKQISITFPTGLSDEEATAQVEAFTTGVQATAGCGAVDATAARLGASTVTNDQIRARSLPEALQNLVLNLQVGQTTPPFGSVEEGVRMLMLCGRDDPETVNGPNFDQMMSQMEEERVGKRAQRYLRDLRNDAYIEYN